MTVRRKPYDAVKRLLDIIGALILLVITAPIQLVVAVLVVVKLGRPVLFKQPRPGKDEKIFKLYKFRSMKEIDEAKGLVTDEDRLTSFGKRLRSTSLDELPSLLHVLKGEMSIVGPRPLRVHYLERYSPRQSRRHEVRPGVTGLAQVSGRNLVDWSSRLEMDVQYVESRSIKLDFQILCKTLATVFDRSGISAEGEATMPEFLGEGSSSAIGDQK